MEYTEKQLWEMNVKKELLPIARELKIPDRSNMIKHELISAILAKQAEAKEEKKQQYIENLQPGQIVAFKATSLTDESEVVLSGKVVKFIDNRVLLKTVSGKEFLTPFGKIIWVKTGERWPRGVYNALKGIEAGCNGK